MSLDTSSSQLHKVAYPLTDRQSQQIRESIRWDNVDSRTDIHQTEHYFGKFELGRTTYTFCVDTELDDQGRAKNPRVRFGRPISPAVRRNALVGLILQEFKRRGQTKQAYATPMERQQIALTKALLSTTGIVYGSLGDTRWSGSCFRINPQRDVVTCAHCVDQNMDGAYEPSTELWVSFAENDFWLGKLVAINYELDAAVIRCIRPVPKPEWLDGA
jgi:hypothetical protein